MGHAAFTASSAELEKALTGTKLAVKEYEQVTKDNQIDRTNKVQDVKFKIKESKHLDKFSGELIVDRTGVQAELDAVLEYLSKIEAECIEKAETYAQRKEGFEGEIAGLKTALNVLETETAFIQKKASRFALRGQRA